MRTSTNSPSADAKTIDLAECIVAESQPNSKCEQQFNIELAHTSASFYCILKIF